MADRGYHSPQFSEDIAWLPPWLQPDQLSIFGKRAKDDGSTHPHLSKNFAFFEDNQCNEQNGHHVTSNDAGYSGCQLYLSGEDSSQIGSTSSTGNVLHFSLHLSSIGTSQLSLDQANNTSQVMNCDIDKGTASDGFILKAIAVNKDSLCLDKADNGTLEVDKSTIEPLNKLEQNSGQRPHRKANTLKLRTADIDDAVELSIAASEAIVISEMLLHNQSDHLLAAAALEAALRVKQARNQQMLEESDKICASLNQEHDETELLSELDECAMADAFDDVGFSSTQIVRSSENLFDDEIPFHNNCNLVFSKQKSLQSVSACEIERNISENHNVGRENEKLETRDVNANGNNSAANQFSAPVMLNILQPVPLSLSEKGPERPQPLGFTASSPRNEALNVAQNVKYGTNRGSLEKDGEVIAPRKIGKKQIKRMFNHETSFISESIESIECSLAHKAEADNEIIESSSTPFINRSEDSFLPNQAGSAGLSSMDLLCSLVPCSIPVNDVPSDHASNQKETEVDGMVSMNPAEAPLDQIFNKHVLPIGQEILFSESLAQAAESKLCKSVDESSGVPTRKKCSSLRPYSVMKPTESKTDCVKSTEDERFGASLNGKRHSSRACDAICIDDVEDRALKRISELRECKCKPGNFTIEQDKLNQAKILSDHTLSNLPFHPTSIPVLQRKRVQFQEPRFDVKRTKTCERMKSKSLQCSSSKRVVCSLDHRSINRKRKIKSSTSCATSDGQEMILQGLEFLLTGFSTHKEKEIGALIRKFGGYVLLKTPVCSLCSKEASMKSAGWKPSIILSPGKVPTMKFLYGCATNSWMLNAEWLADSVQAGHLMLPGKYITRQIQSSNRGCFTIGEQICFKTHSFIFDGVGFLLHGKVRFCTKFSNIIKHGRGRVLTSLQGLVQSLNDGTRTLGVILVENEASAPRHLRHCGLELNIQTRPASWVIESLFCGRLVPFKRDRCSPFRKIKMPKFPQERELDMSEEI